MQYKLVNVTGVRPETFTGELILEPEGDLPAVVGLFEDGDTGNVVAGVSLFNVTGDQIEDTGEEITRVAGETAGFTPQLV